MIASAKDAQDFKGNCFYSYFSWYKSGYFWDKLGAVIAKYGIKYSKRKTLGFQKQTTNFQIHFSISTKRRNRGKSEATSHKIIKLIDKTKLAEKMKKNEKCNIFEQMKYFSNHSRNEICISFLESVYFCLIKFTSTKRTSNKFCSIIHNISM